MMLLALAARALFLHAKFHDTTLEYIYLLLKTDQNFITRTT
jgi:hypothetical protein